VNNRQNEQQPVPETVSVEDDKPMEMDEVELEKAMSQMEHATSEKVDPLEETMIDID